MISGFSKKDGIMSNIRDHKEFTKHLKHDQYRYNTFGIKNPFKLDLNVFIDSKDPSQATNEKTKASLKGDLRKSQVRIGGKSLRKC